MGKCYSGPITPKYEPTVNQEYTTKEEINEERTNIVSPTVDTSGRQGRHSKDSKPHSKPPKLPIHPCVPQFTHTHSSLAMRSIDELKDEDQLSPLSKNHNKGTFRQASLQQLILQNEKEFTMEEISKHNKVDDLWIVLNNNVYDVTDFWQQHPVNPQYVFKYGGQDATDAFSAAGHSQYAEKLAVNMKIGVLAKKDRKHSLSRKMSVVNWDNLEQTDLEREVRIKNINVYPVKGCRGVELESTWIDQSGVFNDRTYVFVDADTHNPINQLKYQKLALIQPVLKSIGETQDMHHIELYYFDERTGEKNSITVKSKYDKNDMIEIEYVNSPTKIISYDQGDEISEWITDYLHSTMSIEDTNKTFRLCKILRSNFRPHIDYFSLPFISKQDQPIKGVLNYSAINLASQESMDELNRRWCEKDAQNENKPFGWERWRVNIVLEGLPKAHFEDFAKFMCINNDVELLWNRRRYLCTVPSVNQSIGVQTTEPQDTLTRYRNAVTLNDTTAKPGTNGVFFGSFFLVKQGGHIRVGDSVGIKQTQFNILRTNRQKSYYGHSNVPSGNKNFGVKTLTQYQSYKLAAKNELTHDTYHLRFELADKDTSNLLQHESLRLNIGGHYLLKIPEHSRYLLDNYTNESDEKISYGGEHISIIRAYTPVVLDEADNDECYFDLVVKIYAKGAMTQYFKSMCIGDLIDGKQYYGGIRYTEIGTFRFGDPSHFQVKHWSFDVNYINMICGGTGLCPMMQIIQCIHKNRHIDDTKINILYSNKTANDILMIDLLNEITSNNENIKVHYVLTTKEDKAENKNNKLILNNELQITQFGKRINRDFIEQYGFKSSADCISLLCGPPRMDIAMNEICKEIGFDGKHIHTF